MKTLRIGIVGARGHVGAELIRLVAGHPAFDLAFVTSRELAEAQDLPGVARKAFSRIARSVEISLFGGRSIDAAAWDACRGAYSELTVPKNWARA